MNSPFVQYQHLSDELLEMLEAFEIKLRNSSLKLKKAQYYEEAQKAQQLLDRLHAWNKELDQGNGSSSSDSN